MSIHMRGGDGMDFLDQVRDGGGGVLRAFLTNFIVMLVTLTNYINIFKNKRIP